MLILRLSDSSGINTTGTGIGHDLMAVLTRTIAGSLFSTGFMRPETDNSPGWNRTVSATGTGSRAPLTLTIKASNGVNNSGQAELAFVGGQR